MKYFLALFIVICFLFDVNAQVKTAFFKQDSVVLDSTKATSYAVYGKVSNDNLYSFKRFDLYNNLMSTGYFKDEALSIPHGKFIYYASVDLFNEVYGFDYVLKDRLRFISEQGTFNNGLSEGKWTSYYPDGKTIAVVNFVKGIKEGEFVAYDKKGIIVTYGKYVNDKKEGEWLFKKGKKKIMYVNDIEQQKVSGSVKTNR